MRLVTVAPADADLVFLSLKNMLFNFVTLGLYRPWAKTHYRKFVASRTQIQGVPLEYNCDPQLLFKGMLLFYGILFIIYLLEVSSLRMFGLAAGKTMASILSFALSIFVISAIYSSRRFFIKHVSLRGIYFGMEPGASGFVKETLIGGLWMTLTLGLYYPVLQENLYAYKTNRTRWGTQRFNYSGSGKDLMPAFFTLLGMIPMMIISPFIVTHFPLNDVPFFLPLVYIGFALLFIYLFSNFKAKTLRYRASKTTIMGIPCKSSVTGAEVLSNWLTNIFILIVTLGMGLPWTLYRSHNLYFSKFSLQGVLNLDQVSQDMKAHTQLEPISDVADGLDLDISI